MSLSKASKKFSFCSSKVKVIVGEAYYSNNYSSDKISFEELFIDYERPSDPCVVLWRSVILQTIIDATNNYKKRDYKTYKAQAIAWLTNNSDDFLEVCENANLEPSYVKKIAANAIKEARKKSGF